MEFFPPAVCAVVPDLIRLLGDSALDASGQSSKTFLQFIINERTLINSLFENVRGCNRVYRNMIGQGLVFLKADSHVAVYRYEYDVRSIVLSS